MYDTDGYSYAIGVKLNFPIHHEALITPTEDPEVLKYHGNDNILQYRRRSDREYHRLDGPALINLTTGVKMWYRYGKCHCETGPAIEDPELGWVEFHIDGVKLNPRIAVNDPFFIKKFPLLVASMLIYLVHEQ